MVALLSGVRPPPNPELHARLWSIFHFRRHPWRLHEFRLRLGNIASGLNPATISCNSRPPPRGDIEFERFASNHLIPRKITQIVNRFRRRIQAGGNQAGGGNPNRSRPTPTRPCVSDFDVPHSAVVALLARARPLRNPVMSSWSPQSLVHGLVFCEGAKKFTRTMD